MELRDLYDENKELTGETIYKQNPNKISSVASLTKMMGLIIIFDFINKGGTTYDEIITVSSKESKKERW